MRKKSSTATARTLEPSPLVFVDRLLNGVEALIESARIPCSFQSSREYDAFSAERDIMEALTPYLKALGCVDEAREIRRLFKELDDGWFGCAPQGRSCPLAWLVRLWSCNEIYSGARGHCFGITKADWGRWASCADGFRYCGKVFDNPPMARGPFHALSLMWNSEGRCVDREDLAEVLYGDREEALNENTLRGLQRRLNDFFRAHRIQYKATVRGYSIAIKDGNPPAARRAKQTRPARKKNTRR